jgi:cysteinyl-tRNA synthetase
MNITDVGHLTDDGDDGEDKLELAAKKEKKHPLEIAKFYTEEFLRDWKTLKIIEPEFRPKATASINEMIELVKVLIDKGHAYISGGNVYFDISTFPEYGKLSGNTLDKLDNNRVDPDPNKKNPQDFVLWFANSKFENHILKWDSPWGVGYPGWHVECSAMSINLLSDAFEDGSFNPDKFETIDIHTGGEDNRFPHHECEIAQTEGATGKQYVNYWLHVRHLIIEGKKMSKSLGNYYTIQGLIDEGFSWRAIRYLLISTHYRSPLNFTKDGLTAAQKSIDRIDDLLKRLDRVKETKIVNEPLQLNLNKMLLSIEEALTDDLNVSGALGALFEFVKHANTALDLDKVGDEQAVHIKDKLFSLNDLFGFFDKSVLDVKDLSVELMDLLEKRRISRENKDWAKSDSLREQLKAAGVEVKDTPKGQDWKLI